jgi:hypothetical protein
MAAALLLSLRLGLPQLPTERATYRLAVAGLQKILLKLAPDANKR